MKLENLRVSVDIEDLEDGVMLGDLRQATLDDLVQVLEGMGAKRKIVGNGWEWWNDGPGTYLVLKVSE